MNSLKLYLVVKSLVVAFVRFEENNWKELNSITKAELTTSLLTA